LSVCRIAEANRAFVAGIIADNAGAEVGRDTGVVSFIAGLGCRITRYCGSRLATICRIAGLQTVAEHAIIANRRCISLADSIHTGFLTVADISVCTGSTVC